MSEWKQLRLRTNEEREKLAGILVLNGYTVRLRRVKEEGKRSVVTVLEYRESEE